MLDKQALPRFSAVVPEQIEPIMRDLIDKNKEKLQALLEQAGPFTWQNLIQPLEIMNDELNRTWSPFSHLHAVMENEGLRKAYNNTLPLLIEYDTEYSQNEKLFKAIDSLAQASFKDLSAAQKKLIENELRDFKLAGVNLSPEKKVLMAKYQQQLGQLTTKFAENLLDATNAWFLHLTKEEDVKGLPEQALELAQDNAKRRKLDGYVITLDFPSYSTAMKFLVNRKLRESIYEAHATRASDVGPNAGKWDNSEVMDEILKVRHELANLVGYKNFAEYSLATKMAKTPAEVTAFLEDLVKRSKPFAEREYAEVEKLALEDGLQKMEVWDFSYYSEKLRMQKYAISQEDLRPYFPAERVLAGMFSLVNRLYGLTIREESGIEVWHPDVKFYSITDDQQAFRGGFYIDLYARPHKRDGAWMDDCINRRRISETTVQYPVAYLTCNFMPPVENKPALLTHEDVVTLFHEFGHCLHHLLTKVDFPSVGGINGVPWDAVEFPSQFMESFCYEKESLDLFAAHYQTGEPLPDALYQKMLAAKYFETGLQMVRQLEFALFDFRLHNEYVIGKKNQIATILADVRDKVAVIQAPAFNRFQHSFSHVFAGSYAAGYYSYKWAEVLSADAYAKFEENGILDRATGKSFMQNILEVGGVRDPMDSFVAFRGRKPTIDALLKQSGIVVGA